MSSLWSYTELAAAVASSAQWQGFCRWPRAAAAPGPVPRAGAFVVQNASSVNVPNGHTRHCRVLVTTRTVKCRINILFGNRKYIFICSPFGGPLGTDKYIYHATIYKLTYSTYKPTYNTYKPADTKYMQTVLTSASGPYMRAETGETPPLRTYLRTINVSINRSWIDLSVARRTLLDVLYHPRVVTGGIRALCPLSLLQQSINTQD